jgi:protein translocase SecG subunit
VAVIIDILHIVACIGLIVVIMLQVTKSEGSSGGAGLGWGTIGGKSSASVNIPVGVERILQPLTTWLALTFLVTALLKAVPGPKLAGTTSIVGPLYLAAMIWGRKALDGLRRAFGEE